MTVRPDWLVVLAGTGTEVGKTWVGCRLAERTRAGERRVAARKPAQSFEPDPVPGSTDAEQLAAATGEAVTDVCPAHRWYPVPMAPPMAAEVLGRPAPTMAGLLSELTWPARTHVGLLETAGGLRSPLALDGDGADLVAAVEPDLVVLVADAGLGAISAVRSCWEALGGRRSVVLLNRFDPADDLHRRNRAWLSERDRLPVVVDTAPIPLQP